jgi:hypothetical protein
LRNIKGKWIEFENGVEKGAWKAEHGAEKGFLGIGHAFKSLKNKLVNTFYRTEAETILAERGIVRGVENIGRGISREERAAVNSIKAGEKGFVYGMHRLERNAEKGFHRKVLETEAMGIIAREKLGREEKRIEHGISRFGKSIGHAGERILAGEKKIEKGITGMGKEIKYAPQKEEIGFERRIVNVGEITKPKRSIWSGLKNIFYRTEAEAVLAERNLVKNVRDIERNAETGFRRKVLETESRAILARDKLRYGFKKLESTAQQDIRKAELGVVSRLQSARSLFRGKSQQPEARAELPVREIRGPVYTMPVQTRAEKPAEPAGVKIPATPESILYKIEKGIILTRDEISMLSRRIEETISKDLAMIRAKEREITKTISEKGHSEISVLAKGMSETLARLKSKEEFVRKLIVNEAVKGFAGFESRLSNIVRGMKEEIRQVSSKIERALIAKRKEGEPGFVIVSPEKEHIMQSAESSIRKENVYRMLEDLGIDTGKMPRSRRIEPQSYRALARPRPKLRISEPGIEIITDERRYMKIEPVQHPAEQKKESRFKWSIREAIERARDKLFTKRKPMPEKPAPVEIPEKKSFETYEPSEEIPRVELIMDEPEEKTVKIEETLEEEPKIEIIRDDIEPVGEPEISKLPTFRKIEPPKSMQAIIGRLKSIYSPPKQSFAGKNKRY